MDAGAGLVEPDVRLLTLAAFMIVAWYLLLGILTLLRWPRTPRAGQPTNELRPEPPAIANLLANGWLLNEDAMPATLLDLSARGFVVIEDRGDGVMQCRLPRRGPSTGRLEPYEQQVVQHLEEVAADGVVPAGALTTGPKEDSKKWWKSFRDEVGKDAKKRGVAREFWPVRLTVLMLILGVPIWLVVQGATGFNEAEDVHQTPFLTVITYTMWAALVPILLLSGTSRLRDTVAGRTAAAHWLGVRESLEALPSFPELPPSAVVTWERHLAYGAALGVAGRAVHTLPFGAEHARRAWTDYGGQWRQVRVRYPILRPGWGTHPGLAALLGLLRILLSLGIFWLVRAVGLLQTSTYGDPAPWWATIVVVAIPLGLITFLIWSGVGLGWALLDLTGGSSVTGEVLRTRTRKKLTGDDESDVTYHVAVYPGTSAEIRAWRVSAQKYRYFHQGQVVTVSVTPRLGYVRLPEQESR
ncbi:MAG TPA: hypothetical protein VHJ82_00575 [Actinomycetota bacterium]|nr:hypothetical protein [Actinomycetota bacterium]